MQVEYHPTPVEEYSQPLVARKCRSRTASRQPQRDQSPDGCTTTVPSGFANKVHLQHRTSIVNMPDERLQHGNNKRNLHFLLEQLYLLHSGFNRAQFFPVPVHRTREPSHHRFEANSFRRFPTSALETERMIELIQSILFRAPKGT